MDDGVAGAGSLQVAFWNRQKTNRHARVQAEWLRTIGLPDVLILAEVTGEALGRFRAELPGLAWYAAPLLERKDHGIAIGLAPGIGVEGADVLEPDCGEVRPCRPERGFFVRVTVEAGPLTIVGWHAPYAAGDRVRTKGENSRYKQQAYIHLGERLAVLPRPLVLGLDGNNWADSADGAAPPRKRDAWDDERLFHSTEASHGLLDVMRSAGVQHQPAGLLPTRRNGATSYRMDRLYSSPELSVTGAATVYGDGSDDASVAASEPPATSKRFAPGSDHALVRAELLIGA